MTFKKILEASGYSGMNIVLPNGTRVPKYASKQDIMKAARQKMHAPRWGDDGPEVALCNIKIMGGTVVQYGYWSGRKVTCKKCLKLLRAILVRYRAQKRKGWNPSEEAVESGAAHQIKFKSDTCRKKREAREKAERKEKRRKKAIAECRQKLRHLLSA